LDSIFKQYIPKEKLEQVERVLYGKGAKELEVSKEATELGNQYNFEIKHFSMVQHAAEEQLRKRRIVKVGAIQTQIVEPTSAPIYQQVSFFF
jgi:beta-ureidopropionase